MHNNRPACLVWTRSGHCSKSITPVRGSCSRVGRAAQLLGAAPQPLESFLGDHLGDPGAIHRHSLPREHQRDLVDE